MKTLKITILIAFILLATQTAEAKTIRVPEYVNGYKTTELLRYLSTLKAKDIKPKQTKPMINKTDKTKKGGTNTASA